MGIEATTNAVKKSKVEKKEEKLLKQNKEMQAKREKEQAAKALTEQIAGSGFDGRYDVKDIRKEAKEEIENALKQLKKDYKSGKIDKKTYETQKELYESAKSYLKSRAWKKERQSSIDSVVRTEIAAMTGNSDATKIKDVRDDVRDDLNELKEKGELSQEQYDAYKKYTKVGSGFMRFLGQKDRESRQMFRTQAYKNNVEDVKKSGPEFSADLQAKMNLAGITADDVYAIGDANGGAADGTINYSYKKKQPGEQDSIVSALNQNENGIQFSKKEAKKIMKQAGYHVEKAVDPGKLATDTARGLLIGAPGSYFKFSQHQHTNPGLIATDSAQSTEIIGVIPAATTVLAAAYSTIKQVTRVEDRAIPTDVPKGVKTYDEYAKYLDDNYSTSKGASLGKDIAKFFIDQRDGKTLLVDQMNSTLSKAAGADGSISTPLNYQEALGLLTDLSSGKIKVEQPQVEEHHEEEPVKENCTVEIETYDVPVDDTECYKVKSGDNWDAVVRGKYHPKSEADVRAIRTKLKAEYLKEMQEKGKLPKTLKVTDAFFPRVGEELCLPRTISVNGNEYEFSVDGKVVSGSLKKKSDGSRDINYGYSFSTRNTNPFLTQEKRADVKACDNPIQNAQGVTVEEAKAAAEKYKKENEAKQNITIVEHSR